MEELPTSATPSRMSRLNRMERFINRYIFEEVHLACLAAVFTGVSLKALAFGGLLYFVRMFLVTGVYHRYFSHRSYKMSRWLQALFAFLGTTAFQRGPIWWAGHHRRHHKHSDQAGDPHSPHLFTFWYSHVMWFHSADNDHTEEARVQDWLRYPELKWIDAHHWVGPLLLAVVCGLLLGWQGLFVSFAWSTVAVWHVTFCINSLAHVYGTRRFDTLDHSRNNWWLAILTLGEGWHNNHHHYQASVRQGFRWWEIDISYYIIWCLSKMRLTWGLRQPPPAALGQ